MNNGDNNGQATHGAHKHAWRTQAAWANVYISCYYFTIYLLAWAESTSVSQSGMHFYPTNLPVCLGMSEYVQTNCLELNT